jgi:hypothetical protein
MPIPIRCPHGHKLNVPSKYAGQTVRCPACQSRIVVPGELSAAAQAVKDAAKKASPPKLPAKKAATTKAASKKSQTEKPSSKVAEPAAAPAPPPFVPAETAPQPAAPAVAFAPDDPAAPVPIGGIVPGSNRQNRLAKFLRVRNLMISDLGYRADRGKRHSVYWLAGTQFALALFAIMPGVWQLFQTQPAPWAHFVICLSLLQIAYAIWLALAPDYSSAEVAMFATGVLAAIYAGAMAVCWLTAPRIGGWLQLGSLKMEYGSKPALWCAIMVLLASLTAYLCGHVSFRWRKSYRQLTLGVK